MADLRTNEEKMAQWGQQAQGTAPPNKWEQESNQRNQAISDIYNNSYTQRADNAAWKAAGATHQVQHTPQSIDRGQAPVKLSNVGKDYFIGGKQYNGPGETPPPTYTPAAPPAAPPAAGPALPPVEGAFDSYFSQGPGTGSFEGMPEGLRGYRQFGPNPDITPNIRPNLSPNLGPQNLSRMSSGQLPSPYQAKVKANSEQIKANRSSMLSRSYNQLQSPPQPPSSLARLQGMGYQEPIQSTPKSIDSIMAGDNFSRHLLGR